MTYLEKLNPQQRRAVEHGGSALAEAGPLLIIAGAGSGKTNTLAHRVAHLIVSGADPRRMLLLTFSRRAAAEMSRRVEHITAGAMRERGDATTASISWSGTFHAIGARLLREYAERIGLDRAFTIHDREDSADLMNLIRHDLGYSHNREAFPGQEHLPGDLFARRQRREQRSTRCSARAFRGAPNWEAELRALFAAYVEAKQRQHVLDYDDLLLYWAQMMAEPAHRGRCLRAFRPRPGRRIPGHQPPAGGDPAGAEAERQRRSPSSATTRSRSTRSAPRPCATFSTFPAISARAPRSSRSNTITARRSRSSPPPMR